VSEVQSEEGRMFQLHPLLRDFLRGRAAQELPEAIGAQNLQRAAGLLRAAGQPEDAISLMVDAANWPEVARLAAEQADQMLAQGRSEMLAAWLETLPPAVLEGNPHLLRALGACRMHASPRAARQLFERAYAGFHRGGDLEGMALSCGGVIDAAILEFDDLSPLEQWCGRLGGLLKDLRRSGAATLVRGLLWREPGSAELNLWLERTDLPVERAAAALLQHLRSGGWTPRAAEEEVEGTFAGLPLRGRIDLVLEKKGRPGLLDLKLSGRKYRREELEQGKGLQIALYSSMLRRGRELPPAGFLILADGDLLTLSPGDFPGATAVEGPSARETLKAAEETFVSWRRVLARGVLPLCAEDLPWEGPVADAGGTGLVEEGALPAALREGACSFCRFTTLCRARVDGGPPP